MELTKEQRIILLENVKDHLLDEDQHLAKNALKSVWLLKEGDGDFLVTHPVHEGNERCMKFDSVTLEWIGLEDVNHVRKYGEKL